MHAHGRTLRQWGNLRLVAVPAAGGQERYYVARGEQAALGTFATLEAAVTCFEAVRAAGVAQVEEGQADAEAERHRQEDAAGIVDLAAYRRRRPRGGAPEGPRPRGAGEA